MMVQTVGDHHPPRGGRCVPSQSVNQRRCRSIRTRHVLGNAEKAKGDRMLHQLCLIFSVSQPQHIASVGSQVETQMRWHLLRQSPEQDEVRIKCLDYGF